MISCWKWIGALSLCCGCWLLKLAAQCDGRPWAREVLAESSIAELQGLAKRLAACPEQRDTLGQLLHNLGVLYYNQNQWDTAAYYTRQAVEIRAELYAAEAHLDLGKSNANLSASLRAMGQYMAAIPPARKAVAIYTQLEAVGRLNAVRLGLAQTYIALGQYIQAEELIDVAIEQSEGEDLLKAYLDKSNIALYRNNYKAVLTYTDKVSVSLDTMDAPWYKAAFSLNRAVALDELGQDTPAELAYLQSIGLVDWEDCDLLSLAHNNLAQYYTENRAYTRARHHLQKGAAIARVCKDSEKLAQNYDHQGELFLSLGQYEKAIQAFQQAQQNLLPGYQPKELWSVPDTSSLARLAKQTDMLIYLADQAKALQYSAEPLWQQKALDVYIAADGLIAQIRQAPQQEQNRLFWRRKVLPLYERAIGLCHQLGEQQRAFYFFEKSKAILLLEAMLENDVLRHLPDSLLMTEKALQASIHKLLQGQPDNQSAAYAQYLQDQAALDQLQKTLQEKYPVYEGIRKQGAVSSPLDFSQQYLRPKAQTLVHYFFGSQRVYALVLYEDQLSTFVLGDADSINARCQQFLRFFKEAAAIENEPAAYAKAAYSLYEAVLAPLGIPANRTLLLLPDGPLAYIPFSALLTQEASAASVDITSLPYLLLRHPVAYTHSAAVYTQQSVGKTAAKQKMIAFAPFATVRVKSTYAPLAFSKDEIAQIQKQFSVTPFLDQEASLANFITNSSDSHILHLSTHAFAGREATEAPHIAFFDGLLYLRDIYQLAIPADLVVLSACQTNIGQLAPGEGVLGLGRAFVQAGAKSIIASLWNVNARSSGYLLSRFYAAAADKVPKPLALHQAQLQYLQDENIAPEQKSPYYWAGFAYYGQHATLLVPTNAHRYHFILRSVAVLLVGLFAFSIWRRFN